MLGSPVPEAYTLNMYSCSALRPARSHWNEIWQCSDEQVRHDNDVLSSPAETVVMKPITRAKRLTVGWDLARHTCGCHASWVCADNRCSGIPVKPDFWCNGCRSPFMSCSVDPGFKYWLLDGCRGGFLMWVFSLPAGYNGKVPKIKGSFHSFPDFIHYRTKLRHISPRPPPLSKPPWKICAAGQNFSMPVLSFRSFWKLRWPCACLKIKPWGLMGRCRCGPTHS